jgi:hypothetical protein
MDNRHPKGHTAPEILTKTPNQVNEEVLGKTLHSGTGFRLVSLVSLALLLLGVVGIVIRINGGVSEDVREDWGYTAAVLAFLLTTGASAPVASIALRMAKAHWRRPVSRIAELWTVVGLLCVLLLIPLLGVIPSGTGRTTIWFVSTVRDGWPPGAPHIWLFVAMPGLLVCGLGLLWVGAIPDFATARDHSNGMRRPIWNYLSLQWEGTQHQWRLLKGAQGILGGFYFMFLVFVHFLISSDLAMSLVPGWKDSIFPAFHALSGLQSAVATTLVTMFVLRTWGGLKDYIGVDQFWSYSKILLATSILWFYFWFSMFFTYWYGRSPAEQSVLKLLMFESYRSVFITAFVMNFLAPLCLLIWNGLRRSVWGPTMVSVIVLIGTFFDRIRIYVASFSIEDVTAHRMEHIPAARMPDFADVFILIGGIGGAVFLYTMASRLVPFISLWEINEGVRLQRLRPFGKLSLKSIGKPD